MPTLGERHDVVDLRCLRGAVGAGHLAGVPVPVEDLGAQGTPRMVVGGSHRGGVPGVGGGGYPWGGVR